MVKLSIEIPIDNENVLKKTPQLVPLMDQFPQVKF